MMVTTFKTIPQEGERPEIGVMIHEGKEYVSFGSFVSPDVLVGYYNEARGTITTWNGADIARARVTSSWRINGWVSDRMYQVRAVAEDGTAYTGRTCGNGMLYRGKRTK